MKKENWKREGGESEIEGGKYAYGNHRFFGGVSCLLNGIFSWKKAEITPVKNKEKWESDFTLLTPKYIPLTPLTITNYLHFPCDYHC